MVRLTKTEPAQQPNQPSSSTRPRTKRRRWWKVPLLLVFCLAFLGSGWFTYKIAAATNKIFTENTTGGSPILRGKNLKGDNGRVNILLMGIGGGTHDGPNLTDTIQVLSVDPKNNRAAMVSIPRDLYVTVPDSFQKTKINEVHSIGEDNDAEGGGPGLLKESVSTVTGVPIHYFIRIDFAGFQQVVDSVGGIDINVEQRLYDPYYPRGFGYQVLDIRPGQQHMNGELALKYARSRETTSDFDRSKRQQQVMLAVRDKALSLQYLTNPGKISQMIDIVGDHVKTDLSLGETERLAEIVKDIPPTNVTSEVLDSGDSGLLYDSIGPGGAYILLPRAGNYNAIHAFVQQLFSDTDAASEGATIEIQNASGRSGLAKTESDLLTTAGFQVVSITNAPNTATQTIVYDYSNDTKKRTVDYLAKRYQAEVVRNTRPAGAAEIRVILGSDYSQESTGR